MKERAVVQAYRFAAVVGLTGLSACSATPPAGWQTGGAALVVPHARWVNGSDAVEIAHDGRVALNGRHIMTIDVAGRAYDPEGEPIALLRDDGMLAGEDDEPMGWVGAGEAILPGGESPWLTLQPSGEVVRSDSSGRGRPFGVWLGCDHPTTLQACTLVTHLMGMELRQREHTAGVSVGVGIGVGVGVGP
jgi:hypothetical protein